MVICAFTAPIVALATLPFSLFDAEILSSLSSLLAKITLEALKINKTSFPTSKFNSF